ncbi:MAG: NADH-quinone oxidoreductase subunit C [Flavobacterium sp. BFFFF2]|nr:MAG: NADH-quinone oxidoreductase subunit C [Flavobacterium sp. BFFFF2]
MALEPHQIQELISQQFPDAVGHFAMQRDIFTFEVQPTAVHELLRFLKEDPALQFHFLTDLCGIHYPESPENEQFSVVYHLHNWMTNTRLRVKTFISGNAPRVTTVSDIFPCANWMERETYDFYGIDFVGHPQLKRILNMDEMISFPMRKEFPMEDAGRTDKDDRFFGRTKVNS